MHMHTTVEALQGVVSQVCQQLYRDTSDSKLADIEAKWTDTEEKMRTVLASLRHKANREVPINRLPIEIMIMIFEQALDIPTFLPAISHTCVHWRTIALRSPGLWTHIDLCCSHPPLWQEWYKRSKTRPLSLHFTPSGFAEEMQWMIEKSSFRHATFARGTAGHTQARKVDDEDTGYVSAEMHRVRAIECVLPVGRGEPFVPPWLVSHAAPALEQLSLAVQAYNVPFWHKFADGLRLPTFILPQTFVGQTPNLLSLSLQETRPRWDSHLFVGLTSLDMVLKRSLAPIAGSDEQEGYILTVLRNSPHLRTLRMVIPYAVQGWDSDLERARGPVSLPHVRHLHLSLAADDLRQVLSCIHIPDDLEKLHIEARGGDGVLADCLSFDPLSLPCFDGIQHALLNFSGDIRFSDRLVSRDMETKGAFPLRLVVHDHFLSRSIGLGAGEHNPPFELDYYADITCPFSRVMHHIAKVHTLQSLTRVSIQGGSRDPFSLELLLEIAPAVNHLDVTYCVEDAIPAITQVLLLDNCPLRTLDLSTSSMLLETLRGLVAVNIRRRVIRSISISYCSVEHADGISFDEFVSMLQSAFEEVQLQEVCLVTSDHRIV